MFVSPGFLRLLGLSNDRAKQATYEIGRAAEVGGMKEKLLAWNRVNEAVASVFNFSANQWYELTVLHNKLFPRYSTVEIDDGISPNDSVSNIASSRLNGASARVHKLAAQRKRALLQQKLRDAVAEAESMTETPRQEAEILRQEAESCRQAAEADTCRQEAESRSVDRPPRRNHLDRLPRRKYVDRTWKLSMTCATGTLRRVANP